MSAASTGTSRRPVAVRGPNPGILALVSTVLFVWSVAFPALLAGGVYPSPFGEAAAVIDYFTGEQSAVRVGAFLQVASAVPLGVFTATIWARLQFLGIRNAGATIALVGGSTAAALQALSGLVTWALSRPDLSPDVIRALHALAFGIGGPGAVAFLGLLVAGTAVPGLLAGLLPRTLAWAGLVIAVVAELSLLVLLVDAAAYLLPVGRFVGLVWLIVAGFRLPFTRRRLS